MFTALTIVTSLVVSTLVDDSTFNFSKMSNNVNRLARNHVVSKTCAPYSVE